jgi:predicted dehydrogenase
MQSSRALKLLLIGCGPHAKRIYLPMLRQLQDRGSVKLELVAELESQREAAMAAVSRWFEVPPELLGAPVFGRPRTMPVAFRRRLDEAVARHGIEAVIISTAPLAHLQYALWAAEKGLHVLMDKPISTRRNVAIYPDQAEKLFEDYRLLCAKRRPDKAFIVNADRRYQPGFRYVFDEIESVARQCGIPVTNMQSSYGDGQWRLPGEILGQDYRSYKVGHGMVSHSGYHTIDVMAQVAQRSFAAAGKRFDAMGVYTSFIRPQGLLRQQRQADYRRVFGEAYLASGALSDSDLAERYGQERLGEVDASSLVTLYERGEPVANLGMSVMHNSFSRRSWVVPNPDLYKGNGRAQHEMHSIQQGPCQNIQIHSYHDGGRHDVSTNDDLELGGNNHFDIYIFRNSDLLGGEPLRVVRSRDLMVAHAFDSTRPVLDQVKQRALEEFVRIARSEQALATTQSDLASHALGVRLMSLVYRSGIARREIVQKL